MSIKIVKLIVGTNVATGKELLAKDFKDLSWWSDNMETLAHYYEGCAIEMAVRLDTDKAFDYVRCLEELDEIAVPIEEYTYGFTEVIYPKGSIWYVFNAKYLKDNLIDIKEIFPDLRQYNEEDY